MIKLRAVSSTNSYQHMVSYYSYEDTFKTSAHRLGFSRMQVVGVPVTDIFHFSDFIIFSNDAAIGFKVNDLDDSLVPKDEARFLLWKPSSATEGQIRVSNYKWFDNCSFVYIVSNKLPKNSSKILRTIGGAVSVPCNVHKKIATDANCCNWVHFLGHESADEHIVDGNNPPFRHRYWRQ